MLGLQGVRHRLLVRVVSLVAFGVLAPVAVLTWAGHDARRQLERRLLEERERLAVSHAAHLGEALAVELEALQAAAPEGLAPADLAAARPRLRALSLRRHRTFDAVLLARPDGEVLAVEPDGAGRGLALPPAVLEAGNKSAASLLGAVPDAQGAPRLWAVVPLRSWDGQNHGMAVGIIRPQSATLRLLLQAQPRAPDEVLNLIDERGTVLASTDPSRALKAVPHGRRLASPSPGPGPLTGTCLGCHAARDLPERERDEVLALAPVPGTRWGVQLLQPRAAAFAAFETTFARAFALGLLAAAVALLLAVGAARSVTRPLELLTAAAERLAAGNLEEPLPGLGRGEEGRLGRAFERMRLTLRESLERTAQINEALERRVAERTAELARANQELQLREEARARLLDKVITAQEDERKRIARELHDETSQSLAALVMALDAEAAAPPEAAGRGRQEARALAVRTLEEVHRLIVDLRPSVLDDLGLESAIRWYAERQLARQGIAVRCEFSGPERFAPQIETALFRVVQEALTNIARHARAETVLVQCAVRDGRVEIEIEDDGQGFDPAAGDAPPAAGRRGGFGLMGMRERVELLGGTLQIDSAPGQGTRLAVSVPLPPEVSHG